MADELIAQLKPQYEYLKEIGVREALKQNNEHYAKELLFEAMKEKVDEKKALDIAAHFVVDISNDVDCRAIDKIMDFYIEFFNFIIDDVGADSLEFEMMYKSGLSLKLTK